MTVLAIITIRSLILYNLPWSFPYIIISLINKNYLYTLTNSIWTSSVWNKPKKGNWNLIIKLYAEEGASNDYTISTTQVRVLQGSQEPGNIQFIFRSDAIAQETNETFTLQLEQASTNVLMGNGVFFMDEMNMVILDSDSKPDK